MILLYGYYKYNNFGDELFKYIFETYFKSKNIKYITKNPDDLELNYKTIEIVDCILLGGGEIINDYFMIPLFTYINYNKLSYIPIYGVSIGYNINDHIHYLDFFDKCIFRNTINMIDNKDYYYSCDIVFSLPNIINNIELNNITIVPYTIGYYLINNIDENKYKIIIEFTNKIKYKYKIRFILFHIDHDIIIVNKIIKDCKLYNYEIISTTDKIKIIQEINKNKKHLCLRYHSHILCYSYKLPFISFPLTSKTEEFDKYYNIKYSFDVNDMILALDNSSIVFQNINFSYDILDSLIIKNNKENIINKQLTLWSLLTEIYFNFINILKIKFIKDENIDEYVNYISDQIELNILNNINTIYRYGIMEKIKNLLIEYKNLECLCYHDIRSKFIKIISDI
jgi:hypothetical protein